MLPNKVLAEKITVFLNLIFHLEDYRTNQNEREDQLHVCGNAKTVLREILSSKKIIHYLTCSDDPYNNYKKINETETVKEFKYMNLTEDKINYIKKVNPQSFNQNSLMQYNFFFDSTDETDMIYMFSIRKMSQIIQFCFQNIMLKKQLQKESIKKSRKDFFLASNNIKINSKKYLPEIKKESKNNKLLRKSTSDFLFRNLPNFIVYPSNDKNNLQNIIVNNKNYVKISKNNSALKNIKLPKYINNIPPDIQLRLIQLLHTKKPKNSKLEDKNILKFTKNNFIDNEDFYNKIISGEREKEVEDEVKRKENVKNQKVSIFSQWNAKKLNEDKINLKNEIEKKMKKEKINNEIKENSTFMKLLKEKGYMY